MVIFGVVFDIWFMIECEVIYDVFENVKWIMCVWCMCVEVDYFCVYVIVQKFGGCFRFGELLCGCDDCVV